jgi:ankyrin repeat protein
MQMERFVDDMATAGLLTKEGRADINERSKSKGRTLLFMLKARKFENALNFLECRPDCNVTDDEGNSPLHYAVRGQRGDSNTQFIKALLAEGANPSLKNRGGETPLHRLTWVDSRGDVVSLLLNAGADIEARDNNGGTWLFHTCGDLRIEHLQKCLDLGARADARDFKGRTVFHEAVPAGNVDLLEELSELGLDLDQANYAGSTPLLQHRTGRAY